MLLASLCFVHCVAGPILLTYAGFSSLIGVSEKFEPLFVLGSAATGLIAFVPAYRKKHGRKSCLALFASGISCLLLRSHIELPSIPIEPIVTAVGASLIICAHILNLKFSKRCQCCDPLSEEMREAACDMGRANPTAQVRFQPDGVYPEIPTSTHPERKR